MLGTELKILLVDDDPALIEMHTAYLEANDYSVLVASDGRNADDLLDIYHKNIGVVVSDINMPKMDGYDLCRKIKEKATTKNIPVIFVSAYTGLEEKMKGYSCGADDYITKPVDDVELVEKIRVLLDIRQQQFLLSKQAAESQSVTKQAMTYSSELGQIVKFYDNVLRSTSHSEISEYFSQTIANLGLICVLQIYTPEEVISHSETGIVTPLESNVIELARDKGRVFNFGARTILNYNSFSLLVKNMPLDDSEKYSRMKDMLDMIGNALESKIVQLNNEIINTRKNSVILSVKGSLNSIDESFSELQKENLSAIEHMSDEMREVITSFGLTESQKNNVQSITEAFIERTNDAFCKSVNIAESLENIYKQFKYVTGIKLDD